ncbi:MAG: methyltransferase domain-containing protein [Neisseriaceae bacterium]|nr:methyltransferase domain-containing protein [Neisseriaceae bacterium]
MLPLNIIEFTHNLFEIHLKNGDIALDATAGNGNDTLHLAKCVGENGLVYAFDIQKIAIDNTQRKLAQAMLDTRVKFILDNHDRISQYIENKIDAAIFNLGYLPNGDKTITTVTSSSLSALHQSLNLLKINGLLAIVVYPGHGNGLQECMAIEQFVSTIKQQDMDILRYRFANRPNSAPYAFVFNKLRDCIF